MFKVIIFNLNNRMMQNSFLKRSSKNRNTCTIKASNTLDPDQARHLVGPNPGPNCLQRLPAEDTSRQRGLFHTIYFFRNKVNRSVAFLLC